MTACPAPHKYKWATGNGTCRDCPANSHTFKTGTSTCTCDNGYFRSIDEDAHQPCTSMLLLTFINELSVILHKIKIIFNTLILKDCSSML